MNSGLIEAETIAYQMHTVKEGETLWTISQTYNQSLNRLQSLNYQDPTALQVGDLVAIKSIQGISVKVDGQIVTFDRQPYIEEDRVFVPLRAIAEALGVDQITWIEETASVQMVKDDKVITITRGSDTATVNGTSITLDAPVQLYVDRIFVPIRFFAEALGSSEVAWDSSSYTVSIGESDTPAAEYSEEDLYWLSRIVHAEAEGEPYEGKLAVANVVINRVASNDFPDTIKEVIFDSVGGIQFTPVADGRIYNTPDATDIQAAIEALTGNNNIGESLFFLNPLKATSLWMTYYRTYYTQIGQHVFYL